MPLNVFIHSENSPGLSPKIDSVLAHFNPNFFVKNENNCVFVCFSNLIIKLFSTGHLSCSCAQLQIYVELEGVCFAGSVFLLVGILSVHSYIEMK